MTGAAGGRAALPGAALPLLLAVLGCGSEGPSTLVLDRPDPSDFYARPFPRDDRRTGDGTLDLAGYPRTSALVEQFLDAVAADRHGFGENAGIFFRFSGPIDPRTLPQSAGEALAPAASVYLVDLDRRLRAPIRVSFHEPRGVFAGPNLLGILPFEGAPLRPATRYAAVVTVRVRDERGAPVGRDGPFAADLAGPLFAPLRAYAAALAPGAIDEIAGATVFTTGDPVSEMRALHDAVAADVPPPVPSELAFVPGAGFHEYDGRYPGPIYQQGQPPYLRPDQGGAIDFAGDGRPMLARTESLRFAVTVPSHLPMPPGGWPVVLYAHGTGGSYRSFIEEGLAERLAAVGLAMISIDQVLHGPRDPTGNDPEVTFFNFQNLAAARDNVRQGATDDVQLLRLLAAWPADLTLPATLAKLSFDTARVAFVGHSQGGLTGPLFVAYEPGLRGAVFSGAAGILREALVNKTRPIDIPALLESFLGEPIDDFHPLLSLVQTYFEPADPVNFGRLFFQEPPTGLAPRSIFQTVGLVDHYAPVPGLKAFLLAMGLAPVGALPDPVDGLQLLNITTLPGGAAVRGNVALGAATGVAAEYQAAGYDGHFVLFENPDAARQSTGFLLSLLASPSGPATFPP